MEQLEQTPMHWGHDTRSILKFGTYTLSTHYDHKGNYRGHQAMWKGHYRGSHFHVESKRYSQDEIMWFFHFELRALGANLSHYRLAIGNTEFKPEAILMYQLGDKTQVLWISGFNHHLHIESNKLACYAKGILTKPLIVKIIKKWLNGDLGHHA